MGDDCVFDLREGSRLMQPLLGVRLVLDSEAVTGGSCA